MKRWIVAVVLAAWVGVAGAQDAVDEAKAALDSWAPLAVAQVEDVLVVITKERRVTGQIYDSMILHGICLDVEVKGAKLPGISEIVILNRFQASGWVFGDPEGPVNAAAECRKVMAADRNDQKIQLALRTYLY